VPRRREDFSGAFIIEKVQQGVILHQRGAKTSLASDHQRCQKTGEGGRDKQRDRAKRGSSGDQVGDPQSDRRCGGDRHDAEHGSGMGQQWRHRQWWRKEQRNCNGGGAKCDGGEQP